MLSVPVPLLALVPHQVLSWGKRLGRKRERITHHKIQTSRDSTSCPSIENEIWAAFRTFKLMVFQVFIVQTGPREKQSRKTTGFEVEETWAFES